MVQTDGLVVFKPLGNTGKPLSLRLWLPQRLTGADSEKLRALSYRLSGSSLVFVGMSLEEASAAPTHTSPT